MSEVDRARQTHGTLISDAHRIAWYFLSATGQVRDTYSDQVLLSQIIIALARRGVTHRIRLANVAISQFGRQALFARRQLATDGLLATN